MPSKYLPIGSVVKLKGNDKKIMIIGYYGLEYDKSVKIYDYMGCSYPEGLLIKNNSYYFDHDNITSVVFYGYLDSSFNSLNSNLLDQRDVESLDTVDEDKKTDIPFVDIKLDNLEELSKDDNSKVENIVDVEIPHYKFDENGIIIN